MKINFKTIEKITNKKKMIEKLNKERQLSLVPSILAMIENQANRRK